MICLIIGDRDRNVLLHHIPLPVFLMKDRGDANRDQFSIRHLYPGAGIGCPTGSPFNKSAQLAWDKLLPTTLPWGIKQFSDGFITSPPFIGVGANDQRTFLVGKDEGDNLVGMIDRANRDIIRYQPDDDAL